MLETRTHHSEGGKKERKERKKGKPVTALSQKEQSCAVLEIASYDILVGFWVFSAINVIMRCERAVFIHITIYTLYTTED